MAAARMPAGKHAGPFTRIAIAGALKTSAAHSTGSHIARAVLAANRVAPGTFSDVLLVGRGELSSLDAEKRASAAEFIAMGARYAAVDYSDEERTARTLEGIQCVISCLSVSDAQAIGVSEPALVRASARAGVTRFFPSQYGPDDENLPPERIWRISKRKRAVIDLALSLGLEYTAVVTGIYYDVIWAHNGVMNWYDEGGKARAVVAGPDGSGTIMSVSLDDIGAYVAAMLSDPDQTKSRNRTVRLVVDTWKTGDHVKLFEELTGRKVEVERYPLGDGVADRSDYPQYPRLLAHNHYRIDPSLSDIGKWPQVRPKRMREWLAEKLAGGGLTRFPEPRSGRPAEAPGASKM
ncbi:hypothetical protein DFJ74DRAFT_696401 [Hyaloraphidium curvatum]|nr:hypothetical protein DFJ74DRAFT_696401 [Hyaloraphidium curvatum]